MSMQMPVANAEPVADTQPLAADTFKLSPRVISILRIAFQFSLLAAAAVGCYLFISSFLLRSVQVIGVSMQPTLQNAERCLLNRWIFYVREPQRGDIVVIRDPADNGLSVKRIIGVQGDRIHLDRGDVVVNGRVIDEPYLPPTAITFPNPKLREQDMVCRQDEFIVMGDNRLNSVDSRHYGPVPRGNILGLIIR